MAKPWCLKLKPQELKPSRNPYILLNVTMCLEIKVTCFVDRLYHLLVKSLFSACSDGAEQNSKRVLEINAC